MGTKKVENKEVTEDKTQSWRCSNSKCQITVSEEPQKKQGKLQCPKCLKLTMQLVGDEDFMED